MSFPLHNNETVLTKYESVFRPGIVRCTKAKATLKFKNTPEPKFFKPRTVPHAVKAKVEENLMRQVKEGILKPVSHSDWATPLVIVPKKDGKVRVCANFKVTVNPQLAIDQYPLPKPDELFQALNGGKRYSKLDLKDAFLQLPLDEESKQCMTINTHKGLFQYQSIPFGVASAPAIFQRVMEQMLVGLEGVVVYLDDITLTAPSDEEHLQRLEEILKTAKCPSTQGCGIRVVKDFPRDPKEVIRDRDPCPLRPDPNGSPSDGRFGLRTRCGCVPPILGPDRTCHRVGVAYTEQSGKELRTDRK